MDRNQLADFLRARRGSLQPEDVGLPRGRRRRTAGLRREEVAALSDISTDYYSRIEQRRGAAPSKQIVAAIARGLRLTSEERDHLFHLAGHPVPHREVINDGANSGLMRILDQLDDTPAQIVTNLGETLQQTRSAIALLGDETKYAGPARSRVYRWFTDSTSRHRTPQEDHARHSRTLVADLAAVVAAGPSHSRAASLANDLRSESGEFAAIWDEHPVASQYCAPTRILHHELGELQLSGHTLLDLDHSQALLIFTAPPGSESHAKLRLLSVTAAQRL